MTLARIKPRERDEIVAMLRAMPRSPYSHVAVRFNRHKQTIAGIARANGLARAGR